MHPTQWLRRGGALIYSIAARLAALAARGLGALLYRDEVVRFRVQLQHSYDVHRRQVEDLGSVYSRGLIFAEDRRFKLHSGIDPIAIIRAVVVSLSGRALQGGSTIHQQLVRTITCARELSWRRKVKELVFASLVEGILPKEHIPGLYLSIGYFGWQMNGIQHAARRLGVVIDAGRQEDCAELIARLRYPQPRIETLDRQVRIRRRKDYILQLLKSRIGTEQGGVVWSRVFRGFPSAVSLPRNVLAAYPRPADLEAAITAMNREERIAFVRLWVSEGIPYAFKECPMLYEEWRSEISWDLSVHPKEITLIGSARFGYSLSPRAFGRPFNGESDLDFALVSSQIFRGLAEDASRWVDDYRTGRVLPVNQREKRHWDEDAPKTVNQHIPNGFVHLPYVCSRGRYSLARRLDARMDAVAYRLSGRSEAPRVSHSSLRVYRDWDAFVSQNFRTFSWISGPF